MPATSPHMSAAFPHRIMSCRDKPSKPLAATGWKPWTAIAVLVISAMTMCCSAQTSLLSCPTGWTPYLSLDDTNHSSTQMCAQAQLVQLPSVDIEFYCENLYRLSTGSRSYVPRALSVHSAADNMAALQLANRSFSILSAQPMTQQVVLLGGAGGFGGVQWYDGSSSSAFVNYAPNVPYDSNSGCLGLQRDGTWIFVSCTDVRKPFLCAFPLTLPSTGVPTPTPSPPTLAPTPAPTVSPAPTATRPPVSLSPLPSCAPGWTLSNLTQKCYQLFRFESPGGRGLPLQDANAYCQQLMPKSTITSVLSVDETSVLQSLMTQSNTYLAFVGGVFMDGGNIGVWYEDNIWYPDYSSWNASASSPSWPTATNQYYSNWNFGEPRDTFGCVAIDPRGRWGSQSCQASLPFICSYIDDGSTWAPATTTAAPTTPTPSTAAPVYTATPIGCPNGWMTNLLLRSCYKVVLQRIAPSDIEAACNAIINTAGSPPVAHTASCSTDTENDFVASILPQYNVSLAMIGVSFVANGTDGMNLDGISEYSAAFAAKHFGKGEPLRPGGCVSIDPYGMWYFTPCGALESAFVCTFKYDAALPYLNVTTQQPTTAPVATPNPTGTVVVPLAQRIASLSGLTDLAVAKKSFGTYTVQSAGGSVDALVLLFSPDPTRCIGIGRADFTTSVKDFSISLQHTVATPNGGRVCVSQDAHSFVPTGITFTVVDVAIAGFVPLSKNLYAPPIKQLSVSPSDILTELSVQRRSSATVQVVGSGNISQYVRQIRFASSLTCNNNLYTLSLNSLPVFDSLFTYQSAFIEPADPLTMNPMLDDSIFSPPDFFYVCVAVSRGGPLDSSAPLLFTRVVNATARVAPEYVAVRSLFVINRDDTANAKSTSLRVPQFSSPRVGIEGSGLVPGMQVLFSYDANSCSRLQQAPTASLMEAAVTPRYVAMTAALNYRLVDNDANASTPAVLQAYAQLTLNHTGLYGVDLSLDVQVLYMCFAHSATEPFFPTQLSIQITRQKFTSLTADDLTTADGALLNLNTGYSGLLRLWGFDTTLWSDETLSNAQISFAQAPGGSQPIGPLLQQCSNVSTFYNSRALSLVSGSSNMSSLDDAVVSTSSNATSNMVIVIPHGFFKKQTTRRMRLCLSIPHPFESTQRIFVPTTAAIDIRPVQLLFFGQYGTRSVNTLQTTVITVAENSDNAVFPLMGYGIRADMSLFLSNEPCLSQADTKDYGYVGRVSRLNISISQPYDVPLSYRDKNHTDPSTASSTYVVLTKADHTNIALANSVFGTSRKPLYVCIYAPQTQNTVYSTVFMLTVQRPAVASVRMSDDSAPAVVTYGSFADLLVTGFGLNNNNTALIPALDCRNVSTYLWRSPVSLSPIPSLVMLQNSQPTKRFANYETMNASWFLPLNQQQTVRIGTVMPPSNVLTRFQWCVNFDRFDGNYSFEATGIPYTLVIPSVNGFSTTSGITKSLVVAQEDPLLGQWSKANLVGPLVDALSTTSNPLYMFLTEPKLPCNKLKTFILTSNSSDKFVVAVNGSMLLLPTHLSNAGLFKVCASALYPQLAAAQQGIEAALQFIELSNISVLVTPPVFSLFTINGTSSLLIRQGQGWILTVDGLGISNRTRLRLISSSLALAGGDCGNVAMPSGLGDIVVRSVFPQQVLFGQRSAGYYILIDHFDSRKIPTDVYFVCYRANQATKWAQSNIRIQVSPHLRQPTIYSYFKDNANFDVAMAYTVAPSKVALPVSTGELNTVNLVGTVGRELAVELFCYSGPNSNTSALVNCGDNKRVMFVRPMDDPTIDPCFIDDEDEDWDNVRGPFILHFGVLTLPRSLTTNVSFYPNMTQPWVMCVETSPDYWRQPTTPTFLLQFTNFYATGFRLQQDTVSNSTASFPATTATVLPDQGLPTITVYAGDVSQVFYINGFGIQYGQFVRFGPNCDSNDPSMNLPYLSNSLLYSNPLMLGDDFGSFVLPSNYFTSPEPFGSIPMCLSNDNGLSFTKTALTIVVNPTRIIQDSIYGSYNDQHVITEAIKDTVVVAMMMRGFVDLSVLRPRGSAPNASAIVFGSQALVMLSATCLYNSEGLPLLSVQDDSYVSINFKHTKAPTRQALKICVRRVRSIINVNATSVTVFATPLFVDTGLKFKVLNLTLNSISVHQRVPGIESNYDIRHLLFQARGREMIVPLVFGFAPTLEITQQNVTDDILTSLDDANTLSFFSMAQLRVGKPCHQIAATAVPARVGTLSAHTALFANGRVEVTPDGLTGFHAPLRVDNDFKADPWAPYSLCLSVDGGRHYLSTGIAYFTASWAPTLYVQASSSVLAAFSSAVAGVDTTGAFVRDVTVYESTSAYTTFTDSRYDSRLLVNTAADYVDSELTNVLNAFTVSSLWTGFVGEVGYAQEGVLYIPSEVVFDGENVTQAVAAFYGSSTRHPLLFSYDAQTLNIDTGISISISPMRLLCLEDSVTNIVVNKEESGRMFSMLTTGPCNKGINNGAMLRLAPNCTDQGARQGFAADVVVDDSSNLLMPASMAYLDNGALQLCLKKYLPVRIAQVVGQEAVYIPTSVTMQLTRQLLIDQVNGVSTGTLVGFVGDAFTATLSGAGAVANNFIFSLVPVDSTATASITDSTCSAVQGYVDKNGNTLTSDSLMDWFPTADGIWTVPIESNTARARLNLPYLVCYSADFGLSFKPVAGGIFYVLMPPTIVSIKPVLARSGTQLFDATLTTQNVAQLSRFSLAPLPSDPRLVDEPTMVGRPGANNMFDYFFNSSVALTLVGNGIGTRSRRTSPLRVALVRASLQGGLCSGAIDPRYVVKVLLVSPTTGAILSPPPYVDASVAAAGDEFILCTSYDPSNASNVFYSANYVLTSPSSSVAAMWRATRYNAPVGWVSTLWQHSPLALFIRAERNIAMGNRQSEDLYLSLGVIFVPNPNATAGNVVLPNMTVDQLQLQLAVVLGIDPSSVALSVTDVKSPSTPTYTVFGQVCPVVTLTIKLLANPPRNVTGGTVATMAATYLSIINELRSNTSTTIQYLAGNIDRHVVALAALFVNVSLDDGTPLRGSAPGSVLFDDAPGADVVALEALRTLTYEMVLANPMADLSTDDLQPKVGWSAIPLILVFPFILVFATYQIYLKKFDIVTPEQLEARKQMEEEQQLAWKKRKEAMRKNIHGDTVMANLMEAGLELKDTAVKSTLELKDNIVQQSEGLKEVISISNVTASVQAAASAAVSVATAAASTASAGISAASSTATNLVNATASFVASSAATLMQGAPAEPSTEMQTLPSTERPAAAAGEAADCSRDVAATIVEESVVEEPAVVVGSGPLKEQ